MHIAIAVLLLVFFIYLSFRWSGVALLSSLPASLLCSALLSEMYIDNDAVKAVAILISAIVFPVTLLIVTVRGARTDVTKRKWPHILAFWTWRIIYYLVLLAGLTIILNILGVVTWFVYIIFEHRIFVANRQSIALDVISTIGSCVRQNLPLPMALAATADGYRGRRKRIFLDISRWLTEGYCLGGALRLGYPRCPVYITSMVDAAEKVNQLPEAIRSIEAEIEGNASESSKMNPVDPSYPITVVTVAFSIMFGLMIFIIPTFGMVLSDISGGLETMPRSTLILIDIADYLISGNGIIALLILLVLIFLNIGLPWIRGFYRKFPRKVNNPAFIIRLGDFFKWHLPILHWFEFNYSIMRVTGLLRVSLKSGCPVNDAIRNAGDLDLNNCFRKRLSRWLTRVEQGQNISAAALDTGMGNSLAWAFDDRVNAGNTPEILGMLEKFYRASYNFKANVVRAIAFPCTILLLGAMVGFIVYAMFVPMVSIITHLTETALP
ncbi:MAG: hypothetical protein FVQ82_02430 [Planctomycetes bacterium]|nr:hypothetical protein [Planctomycetota bacterium]